MIRAAVPAPVTEVIDSAGAWLPPRLAAVEARLGELVGGHGAALAVDAATTLEAGGKRLRPLLVLLSAGPGGGEEAIRGAAAVELVHMATLVHDDVIDAAPLRRGTPTIVARSGRKRALATGDLLFSRAFAELTDRRPGEPGGSESRAAAEIARRQVSLLNGAAVSLALGELAQRRDSYDVAIPEERYLERCMLKTAALFECACVIGRRRKEGDRVLRRFGRAIGLGFQLLDDVLDVAGPAERTGKARGTDLLDGTVTLPLILARGRDPRLATVALEGLGPAGAAELCERIAATGALEAVRNRARGLIGDAKRALEGSALDPEHRRLLSLIADGVVERYA